MNITTNIIMHVNMIVNPRMLIANQPRWAWWGFDMNDECGKGLMSMNDSRLNVNVNVNMNMIKNLKVNAWVNDKSVGGCEGE